MFPDGGLTLLVKNRINKSLELGNAILTPYEEQYVHLTKLNELKTAIRLKNRNDITIKTTIPQDVLDLINVKDPVFPEPVPPVSGLFYRDEFNQFKGKLDVDLTDVKGALQKKADQAELDKANAILADRASKASTNSALLYARALEEMNAIPVGALNTGKNAIERGRINIAIVGDSITEGADLVSKDDSYASRLATQIKKELPNIQVNFSNFALSSRRISDFNNPNFKGMTSDPTDRHAGFWRTWSILDKSWRDHVKDFAPDLLIVAFGMNDTGGTNPDEEEYNSLVTLRDFVNTWGVKPSLAFVTPFMPAFSHSQSQTLTLSVARAIRYFAKENGYPLADVNRIYKILRDGVDDVTRETSKEVNFEKFSTTQWTGDKTSFAQNGSNLTPVADALNKFVANERPFYNGSIEVSFLPDKDGAEGNLRIEYRRHNDYGRMTLIVIPGASNGQVILSKTSISSTTIGSKSNLNIPYTSVHKIKIVVEDTLHSIYLNDTLLFSASSYQKLHEGAIRMGSDRYVPGFANLTIMYKDPVKGDPLYTESQMLGVVGGTQSGNGINHPTGQGHALFYLPTLNGVQNALKTGISLSVQTPSLQNGWVEYDAGKPLRVIKENNTVMVNGFIKGGVVDAGTLILTLPEGFRPKQRSFYAIATTSGSGTVEVDTLGRVKVATGSWTSSWIGVSFVFPNF